MRTSCSSTDLSLSFRINLTFGWEAAARGAVGRADVAVAFALGLGVAFVILEFAAFFFVGIVVDEVAGELWRARAAAPALRAAADCFRRRLSSSRRLCSIARCKSSSFVARGCCTAAAVACDSGCWCTNNQIRHATLVPDYKFSAKETLGYSVLLPLCLFHYLVN